MPVNIVDGTLFTDPIVCFTDGDLAGGPGLDDPIQGLANRTRNLLNRIAAEEATRAALSADVDDDYGAGQWLTKTGYEAYSEGVVTGSWSTVGGGNIYVTNAGTSGTIVTSFALPWYTQPLEIAMWGVQTGSPTTRAGISASFYQTSGATESVARVNFTGAGDYLQRLLTLSGSFTWSANKGAVQMTVHAPDVASGFQLHGVGVRFQYKNRDIT